MFLRELRYAVRMLARTPGFTAVAALSVALGIGANSALFSMHDAILLRPLPVPDAGHVVTLNALSPDDPSFLARLSYPNYRDLRGQARSFDGLVAFEMSTFSFGRSRDAVRDMRLAMMVSDNFFDVLGIQPALGRRFAPGEGRVPGRDAIVVLGHDFWQNTLAGDASLLNAVVVINGIEFTVIGVAPASFTGLDQFVRPAFYVPLMMSSRLTAGLESGQESATENRLEDRTARSFIVKGRLKSGVSLPSAQGELTGLWKQLDQQYPEANRNRTITVRTELQERIRAQPRNAILTATMTTLAAIVLMIACANVANLMLGRARARSREIAVRLALGITRMQLLRQLLTESLLLALLGGLLGVGFGYAGIQMLLSFLQTVVPTDVPVVVDLRLDHRVLAFSFLAALVSAALFGLAPAWQSLNTPLVPALKSSEFSDVRRRRTTIGRNVLVIAQIALSMILLVAAGMLEAGFRKTLALDPGFRTDHLMMMSLNTSHVRYTSDQTRSFYRNLVDGARALPGAASVTLTSAIPLDRGFSSAETLVPEGYQFPQGQETAAAAAAVVDERYFATMKTDVIRGRAFTPDDHAGSRRVAIVNEQFALTYWPGQEPIGKRIRLTNSNTMVEVVGLTPTEKYRSIVEPPTSFLYLPFAQHVRPAMSLLVETTTTDATGLAPAMRELVRSLNAGQPISNLRTFASFYRQQAVAAPLLLMRTTVTMGLLGLTLALVGLYGVVAYSVARRTREIGIRMAIGAARSDVLVMILRQGLGLAVAGVLVGGAASLAFARLLTAGTAGIGAVNPATYVIVPIALIGLTMVASYFPARRAARVDPLLALRYE